MNNKHQTYIYLDTKIAGAMAQLLKYFTDGVFDKNEITVLYKSHIKINRHFAKKLASLGLKSERINSHEQLYKLGKGIVFYLFNAQSNCRIVANRNLTHVFITHGESNKLASIKPIIRIYDHIIVSGLAGLERYLHYNLFYHDDIARKRLIMHGETFVGQMNCYPSTITNNAYILYAPTWEGGIKKEDYSSLLNTDIFKKIYQLGNKLNTNKVIIQAHPNLGHRLRKRRLNLLLGVRFLLKQGFEVVFIPPVKYSYTFLKLLDLHPKLSISKQGVSLPVLCSITDVSAMEVQCINKNIPTYTYIRKDNPPLIYSTTIEHHYDKCGFHAGDEIPLLSDSSYWTEIKNYYIQYECNTAESIPLYKKIPWLINYIDKNN